MKNSSDPAALSDDLARRLKVLADPRRLRILDLLMEGVQCNCEIGDELGMSKNLISHHLRVLREAGLVKMERDALDGRWVYYTLDQETLQALVTHFDAFFDPARIQPRHPQCGPRRRQEKPTKKVVLQSSRAG